jgi:hypothetical protein
LHGWSATLQTWTTQTGQNRQTTALIPLICHRTIAGRPANTFFTGTSLVIDGGFTAQ